MKTINTKVRLVKNALGEFGQITSKELTEFAGVEVEIKVTRTKTKE